MRIVAHALVRAASTLVSAPGGCFNKRSHERTGRRGLFVSHKKRCRGVPLCAFSGESERGTHECARHI